MTEGIIGTGITEKIRPHNEALQREVEQAKLEGGEALDKVKEWGKELELKIDAADTERHAYQRSGRCAQGVP